MIKKYLLKKIIEQINSLSGVKKFKIIDINVKNIIPIKDFSDNKRFFRVILTEKNLQKISIG